MYLDIVVDSHVAERGIANALEGMLPPGVVSTSNLDVGDVLIATAGKRLLIERKKFPTDLCASICDKRIFEQVERMVEVAAASETETVPVVLLCGNPMVAGFECHGVKASSVYGVLNWMQFKKGVTVLWVADGADNAAARLFQLGKKLLEDTPEELCESKAPNTTLVGGKRKRSGAKDDVASARVSMLQGVPGMSHPIATALLDAFKTVRGIARAQAKDVAAVKVGEKRKVGPVLAARLHKAFN